MEELKTCSLSARLLKFTVFNDLKDLGINPTTLRSNIRLYFDSIIKLRPRSVKVINTYNVKDHIEVFKMLKIIEEDEDHQKEQEIVRADDCIMVIENGEQFFAKVLFFMKQYNVPHSTGHKQVKKVSISSKAEIFVCMVDRIEHRVHIVPDDVNMHLINHDINKNCWASNTRPLLPVLDTLITWSSDPMELCTADDETDEFDEFLQDNTEDNEGNDTEVVDDENNYDFDNNLSIFKGLV